MITLRIKQVCSLGSFCHTAYHLKRYNLRDCSYPFDWTLSSPKMIMDCLRDDFKTFLDPSYHEQMEPAISSNHVKYGSMVSGRNFEGINNLNLTFPHRDITIKENHEYYQRCVERFRTLLQSPEPKLFILCVQDEEYDPAEIRELRDALRMKTTNAHILCISLFNDMISRYTFDQEDGIRYLKIHTYSRSDGRGFAKDADNDYLHFLLKCLYDFELR